MVGCNILITMNKHIIFLSFCIMVSACVQSASKNTNSATGALQPGDHCWFNGSDDLGCQHCPSLSKGGECYEYAKDGGQEQRPCQDSDTQAGAFCKGVYYDYCVPTDEECNGDEQMWWNIPDGKEGPKCRFLGDPQILKCTSYSGN